ncbi:MAG: filamentous hemagglutinin N-terminal domain-containing protein [Acaryochloris sp. CRU_2_0]|nr:filamentous hemagglutinin N-terminal domain-containing protein [Acaryochloris sp. CRU_2_0]
MASEIFVLFDAINYSVFGVELGKKAKMLKLLTKKSTILVVFLTLLEATSTHAQVIPDGTVNSRATPQGNTFLIEGGAIRGRNLFHSFESFSVPTGETAYFNNAASIQNIVSRVTGTSASSIDGILKANGTANLFFLNPNGIIFGKNARLDIGGSFLGTTADSIKFADGTQFSATTPQSFPLLTVTMPVSLQLGSDPGEIRVTGDGHQLSSQLSSPISRKDNPLGLQVLPGKTFALVGGSVLLNGGTIFAPGGRIEVGSTKQAQVTVDTTNTQWSFGYQPESLGKIELSNKSLLDTSGKGGASLGIYGKQIILKEDSVILMQNQGGIPDKEMRLEATDLIDISSAALPGTVPAGLYSESTNTGSGAQISLFSPAIVIHDGGVLFTRTFTSTKGGNISIDAPNYLNIVGTSPIDPVGVSIISSLTFDSGAAGNINVATSNLALNKGGRLSSATFGKGTGGTVLVEADLVEVNGFEPQSRQGSAIRSGSLGPGNAGSLVINASELILADGGRVNTSTQGSGDGGDLTINARESIEVIGNPEANLPTSITANAFQIEPRLRKRLKLPAVPSGNSGNITINTPRLTATDGGQITVRNEGTGNAGELKISANNIILKMVVPLPPAQKMAMAATSDSLQISCSSTTAISLLLPKVKGQAVASTSTLIYSCPSVKAPSQPMLRTLKAVISQLTPLAFSLPVRLKLLQPQS